MQSLLGFWVFQVNSVYITRTTTILCCDDGFGNLIPSQLPTHFINTLEF